LSLYIDRIYNEKTWAIFFQKKYIMNKSFLPSEKKCGEYYFMEGLLGLN